MPNYTLADGFQQVKENFETIIPLIIPEVTGVFSYVVPEGATAPYAQFFLGNTQYTRISAGQQQFNVSVRVRFVVERVLAGHDGQTQDIGQWTYTPQLLEGFEKYGSLTPPGGTPVPLLDTLNTAPPTMTTSIEGHDFALLFNWTLIFKTSIQRC